MLFHRLRRWPNIEPTLRWRIVPIGTVRYDIHTCSVFLHVHDVTDRLVMGPLLELTFHISSPWIRKMYLPRHKVVNTPFHIRVDDLTISSPITNMIVLVNYQTRQSPRLNMLN